MNLKVVAGNTRLLVKANEELYAEAKKVRTLLDDLHLRHRELSAEVGTCHDMQAKDRAEVKRITGTFISVFSKIRSFLGTSRQHQKENLLHNSWGRSLNNYTETSP